MKFTLIASSVLAANAASLDKKVTTKALLATKEAVAAASKNDVARNIFGGEVTRSNGNKSSFIKNIDYSHKLRICNAYPYKTTTGFEVYKGTEKLTTDEPLTYKKCRDFDTKISEGDKIEFRMNDNDVGTFSINELPKTNALLFLAIYRHDTVSAAVSFASHVFANLMNSQIAVIDTFRGKDSANESVIKIVDQSDLTRAEELRFDAVVAVNAGRYQVQDVKADAKAKTGFKTVSMADFTTQNRESYVVMRVGVEDESSKDSYFPEEIVVFPQEEGFFGANTNGKTLLGIAGFGAVGLLAGVLIL